MDYERALETQRLALLRLLAGMMAVVVLVTFAPAVSMMPRWVREAASALLVRMESAADSLVFAAAAIFCGYRGTLTSLDAIITRAETIPDNGFSTEILLHRMAKLRAVLEDLPRAAKRLVKRLMRTRNAMPKDAGHLEISLWPALSPPITARIDRPPDRRLRPAFCV